MSFGNESRHVESNLEKSTYVKKIDGPDKYGYSTFQDIDTGVIYGVTGNGSFENPLKGIGGRSLVEQIYLSFLLAKQTGNDIYCEVNGDMVKFSSSDSTQDVIHEIEGKDVSFTEEMIQKALKNKGTALESPSRFSNNQQRNDSSSSAQKLGIFDKIRSSLNSFTQRKSKQ